MKLITRYPTPVAGLTLGMIGICIFWASVCPQSLAPKVILTMATLFCLLYTSDAADE